ncbi:unnamed protein product [Trichogramma brassicae]|uniref:Uncharacterized protein n=1 Tax=Trichogramma brassicae TaxID=86971 RepID=A0A6H5HXG9_9HYME|nr:unnamed protein product [Trichogramma brassicae]
MFILIENNSIFTSNINIVIAYSCKKILRFFTRPSLKGKRNCSSIVQEEKLLAFRQPVPRNRGVGALKMDDTNDYDIEETGPALVSSIDIVGVSSGLVLAHDQLGRSRPNELVMLIFNMIHRTICCTSTLFTTQQMRRCHSSYKYDRTKHNIESLLSPLKIFDNNSSIDNKKNISPMSFGQCSSNVSITRASSKGDKMNFFVLPTGVGHLHSIRACARFLSFSPFWVIGSSCCVGSKIPTTRVRADRCNHTLVQSGSTQNKRSVPQPKNQNFDFWAGVRISLIIYPICIICQHIKFGSKYNRSSYCVIVLCAPRYLSDAYCMIKVKPSTDAEITHTFEQKESSWVLGGARYTVCWIVTQPCRSKLEHPHAIAIRKIQNIYQYSERPRGSATAVLVVKLARALPHAENKIRANRTLRDERLRDSRAYT